MIINKVVNKVKHIAALNFSKKTATICSDKPLVSFTFDDFPSSAYDIAGKILNENNLKATYYVSLDLINTQNHLGKMFTTDHLNQAIKDGHELGSHTFDHLHSYKSNFHQLYKSIVDNSNKVNEYLPGYSFQNFSYPYGEVTPQIKKLAINNFSSARSSRRGINTGAFDIMNLKAIGLYQNSLNIEGLKKTVIKASEGKNWLIFYTHDVRTDYSIFGCSSDYFKTAVELCLKMDVEILKISDVVKKLKF